MQFNGYIGTVGPNRECLKFDKVGKPSSSTIITSNNY